MKKMILFMVLFLLVACQQQVPKNITVIEYIDAPYTPENITVETNDCFSLQGAPRDSCFISLAQRGNDSTQCASVLDYTHKVFCYQFMANLSQNPVICTKINNDYERDTCYLNIAIGQVDHILCKNLVFDDRKDQCYSTLAFIKEQKGLCKIIEDAETQKDCYRALNVSVES